MKTEKIEDAVGFLCLFCLSTGVQKHHQNNQISCWQWPQLTRACPSYEWIKSFSTSSVVTVVLNDSQRPVWLSSTGQVDILMTFPDDDSFAQRPFWIKVTTECPCRRRCLQSRSSHNASLIIGCALSFERQTLFECNTKLMCTSSANNYTSEYVATCWIRCLLKSANSQNRLSKRELRQLKWFNLNVFKIRWLNATTNESQNFLVQAGRKSKRESASCVCGCKVWFHFKGLACLNWRLQVCLFHPDLPALNHVSERHGCSELTLLTIHPPTHAHTHRSRISKLSANFE